MNLFGYTILKTKDLPNVSELGKKAFAEGERAGLKESDLRVAALNSKEYDLVIRQYELSRDRKEFHMEYATWEEQKAQYALEIIKEYICAR